MMPFEKTLWNIQSWNIYKDGDVYPYSVEYTGEDEDGGGSVFRIQFLDYDQEYLEEDVAEFFEKMTYEMIRIQKQERKTALQSVAVRYYQSDISDLKNYAKKNACSYQVLMRNAIRSYTESLKENS